MNNLTQIKIISAPRQAIAKLVREGVPVYNCNKSGAYFIFSVPDNLVKKVFAIFSRPCYNITIEKKSTLFRLRNFCIKRAFLLAGGLIFIFSACLSNAFVLRVEITGSGAYLDNAVRSVLYDCGVREYSLYRGGNEAAIISRVLSLPDVVFCSVQKRGSVLYVDVQTNTESGTRADYSPLKADRAGRVESIVAICGTPLVAFGDSVGAGDTLIAAYSVADGQNMSCLAVGYAILSCTGSVSYAAERESEQNLSSAYAAALLYIGDGEITERSYTVSQNSEGVVYTVDFTYLHTISINFD